jgi:Protein of unknown function (DUF2793)
MMTEHSARFELPFLVPGQAQKEVYHNEALAIIDAISHAVVEDRLTEPPGSPAVGQAWIVGEAATDAWAGHDRQLAVWTGGGWRFVAPVDGMTVLDKAVGYRRFWAGSDWDDGVLVTTALMVEGLQVVGSRQPAPPNPSGGTIIDAEARAAIAAITVALRSHGLVD